MALLIMGLDMPQSCSDCPCEYDNMRCQVTGESFFWMDEGWGVPGKPRNDLFDFTKERLPSCPLAYVKEVWAT